MAHELDTPLIRITGNIARVKFNGTRERKLKPTNGYIRKAVALAGKELGRPIGISEMTSDAFSGHPFLVWALLAPNLEKGETLTVDNASDLIDDFLKAGGKSQELANAMVSVLAEYLHVEVQKTDDEGDDVPNGDTPEAPGPSDG